MVAQSRLAEGLRLGKLRGPANTAGKHVKADPGLPRKATRWSSCHTRHLPIPSQARPEGYHGAMGPGLLGQPHGSCRGLVTRDLNA